MIDGLKSYPKMKDSGVPWLDDVPEHWEVKTIGRMGRLFKGNGGSKADEVAVGVPCVRYGDLYTRHEFFIQETKACVSTERAEAYTPIEYGDLLFAASGETMEDIGRSSVNLLKSPACCGGDILVLRPEVPVNPRFLGYAADAPSSRHQKATMGRGFTVVHVYASQIKQLVLPVPPLPEQAAIVRFLDHADQLIRRHIRAKKKLLGLLNEQKQAIIHETVTRGISSDFNAKPSGIEWLGNVPEHWTPIRLKAVASIQTGITLGKNYGSIPLVERPYLRVANVQAGSLDLSKVVSIKVPIAEAERSTLRSGDVLMTEGGDIDKLGRGCIWQGEITDCLHQNHLFAVRTDPSTLDPKFLVALLASRHGRSYFEITAKKTTNLASTNSTTLGNFPLFLPDIAEQEQILAWIAEHTSTIDLAIGRAVREINLLQEYRTGLIADVVTGKIDVREAAAQLPEESEDLEAVDDLEDAIEDGDLLDDSDLEKAAMEAGA